MKSLFENWRKFTNDEQQRIDERGYGFMQRAGAALGLTKDFNYESPIMPYGGFTKDGKEFIVVQFPDFEDMPYGDYLVRWIDGTEEMLSGKNIRTSVDNVDLPPRYGQNKDEPEITRDIGVGVKRKMEAFDES